MKNDLLKKYLEIESIYKPWLDLLQNSVNKETDKSVEFKTFKGFQTLRGRLVKRPLVLFIGLNPGPGRYNEKNKVPESLKGPGRYNEKNKVPEPLKGPRSKLFCFNPGALSKSGYWWEYEYHKNQKIHNSYVRKFVKLMCFLADELGLKELEICGMKGSNEVSNGWLWSEWIQNMVMCTNLFPFSTTNESDLKKLLYEMKDSPNAPCESYKGKKLWEFENEVFVKPMKQLIQLVEPQVVVCLSKKVFHNLTDDGNKTKVDENGLLFCDNEKYRNYIGIHRRQGWWVDEKEGLKKLAELIASYR